MSRFRILCQSLITSQNPTTQRIEAPIEGYAYEAEAGRVSGEDRQPEENEAGAPVPEILAAEVHDSGNHENHEINAPVLPALAPQPVQDEPILSDVDEAYDSESSAGVASLIDEEDSSDDEGPPRAPLSPNLAQNVWVKYRQRKYPFEKEIAFMDEEWWAYHWCEKRPSIQKQCVFFGPNFEATESHMKDLAVLLGGSVLTMFVFNAKSLFDSGVSALARFNPKLEELSLLNPSFVSDKGLAHVVNHCPNIRKITFAWSEDGNPAGNSWITLRSPGLLQAFRDEKNARRLRYLHISNAVFDHKGAKLLSKIRPKLHILGCLRTWDWQSQEVQTVQAISNGGLAYGWKCGKRLDAMDFWNEASTEDLADGREIEDDDMKADELVQYKRECMEQGVKYVPMY
ncbi:hypothetical protein J4E85_002272 [Alternaria conjuncta]|uniref:uncharacterized protein n=1 Tax=Alternaria conjuncta TaxID=181017 RepID=UPI00221E9AE3|nr:uncharacterized protein J4E85_002272 [Alternaria conjuncta]KAI4934416.1 hypothetical protein J4E85_002272 [Alternaria conjuncta]